MGRRQQLPSVRRGNLVGVTPVLHRKAAHHGHCWSCRALQRPLQELRRVSRTEFEKPRFGGAFLLQLVLELERPTAGYGEVWVLPAHEFFKVSVIGITPRDLKFVQFGSG